MNVSSKTKQLSILGLFIAITVLFVFSPVGLIRLPFVSVTIAYVPVLLATMMFGLVPGLIIAFVFGLCTLIQAFQAAGPSLDVFFINPLVSIVPRLLIPVVTAFVYQGMCRFKNSKLNAVAPFIGAFVGSLTNSVAVLTAIYLVKGKDLLALLQASEQFANLKVGQFLVGLFLTVSIGEMLGSGIITGLLIIMIQKAIKR